MLYIVATPIGNLGDITDRAKQILSQVDVIAAEDTRHSGKLLHALGISRPLISLHEHNEAEKSGDLIKRVLNGESIALISDAGTPLISDPGYRLVDLAHDNEINVVPVPGVSAVMTALSVAGIGTADYRFIGFLPAKAKQRREKLSQLVNETATIVLFESPHRIIATLADCVDVLGQARMACFCRELTKKFETIYRAVLSEIQDFVTTDENQQRGEIVLVISGNPLPTEQNYNLDETKLMQSLLQTMSLKDASMMLAQATGNSKKHYYEMGLGLKGKA